MLYFKDAAINYFKGIFIGIGCIIPGVSGGTAAIVIGVFEDMLEAVGNIFKHIRKSISLLLPILAGAVSGILLISTPLKLFCSEFPQDSKYIFCLFSLVSTIMFIKKSLNGNFTFKKGVFLLLGSITSVVVSVLLYCSETGFQSDNFPSLFFIGIPLALALVLPAISFSYMLLFFGLYEKTLNAISNFDIYYIISLGAGIIFGVFIFSKILFKLIKSHSQETYSFVLGFVLCSITDILI